MPSSDESLKNQLNLETGQIAWPELQRHFARGVVIKVGTELDLVDVAVKFVKDDKTAIETWLNNGSIAHANDDDAKTWTESAAIFWAVVVAPWVLIQEK
ncbi:MAG: hypothetical protein AMJ53_00455 [Gammaproteobacteria bacterium SG8_11]|nr:MAG: hypothetical protein AMJ53_00455 [Gammaproteobacteria bacterium SG8_11]